MIVWINCDAFNAHICLKDLNYLSNMRFKEQNKNDSEKWIKGILICKKKL